MAAYEMNVSHAGPPCQYLAAIPIALSRRPRMASADIAVGVVVAGAAVGVMVGGAASGAPGRRRQSSGLCTVHAMWWTHQ